MDDFERIERLLIMFNMLILEVKKYFTRSLRKKWPDYKMQFGRVKQMTQNQVLFSFKPRQNVGSYIAGEGMSKTVHPFPETQNRGQSGLMSVKKKKGVVSLIDRHFTRSEAKSFSARTAYKEATINSVLAKNLRN